MPPWPVHNLRQLDFTPADFFSSFWNQFGPNCTTFLVAAEVYPTDAR